MEIDVSKKDMSKNGHVYFPLKNHPFYEKYVF